MSFISYVLTAIPYSNRPPVQDVIAKLHSFLTCNLLIGLAVLLSYRQFGGRPIECITPSSFSRSWVEYVENYCFTSSTYYVPIDYAVERVSTERKSELQINYYRWMPFFLLFQAACFKLPSIIWKYFHGQSGIRVGEIIRLASNESNTDPKIRTAHIESLCVHLQKVLKFYHRLTMKKLTPHKVIRILNIKYSTYYVCMIYLLSKILFLINVVVQLHLLTKFLIPRNSMLFSTNTAVTQGFFAYDIWHGIFTGNTTWKDNGMFPRVTLCDFQERTVGQTVNHTVQCVLVINLFTEKVFITLWLWYVILSIITLANVTNWIFSLINPICGEHFIFNHLEMSGGDTFMSQTGKDLPELQAQVKRFINKYLKLDGLFILLLIAQYSDVVFITDLIYGMWESHFKIEKQRQALRATEPQWREQLKKFEELQKGSKIEAIGTSLNKFYSPSRRRSQKSVASGLPLRKGSLVRTASAETLPTLSLDESSSDEYLDTFFIKHEDENKINNKFF